jgi:hypothetical protein
MKAALSTTRTKVADEVWIVCALLHLENPKRDDFTVEEIMERATQEFEGDKLRPGFYVHLMQHCVANRAPNPGRYRMLTETAPGRRRLFRLGDSFHPQRDGSKTVPDQQDLPEQNRPLLDWYREWNSDNTDARIKNDPLLTLRGDGMDLWADEPADEYVRRIREGWE